MIIKMPWLFTITG